MVELSYASVILTLSIVLQLGAAYFAYKLMRISGTFKAWTLIIIASVLMALRRTTTLLISMEIIPELTGTIEMIDTLVTLVISICSIWGMYELFKIFLEFKKQQKL